MLKTNPDSHKSTPMLGLTEKAGILDRLLQCGLPCALIVMDAEERVLEWSEGASKIYGYRPAEVVGRAGISILHPNGSERERPPDFIKKAIEVGFWEGEVKRVRRDGTVFCARVGLHRCLDDDGRFIGLIELSYDLTENKRAEDSLHESQRVLNMLVANMPGMVYRRLNDPRWTMVYVSEGVLELTGHRRSELEAGRPASFGELIHPDDRDWVWASCQASLKAKRPCDHEYRMVHKSGGLKWVWDRGTGIYGSNGTLLAIEGFITDITARKRSEERLVAAHRQLRDLSARLQSIREEERIRIAREIHDELGQELTGIHIDLARLAKDLSEEQGNQKRGIHGILKQVSKTIHSVRRICTELRPHVLDDLGLSAAVEWQAQEFQNRTGIRCKFVPRAKLGRLENNQATALFRILQETLSNVGRHAKATRVDIALLLKGSDIMMTVRDNGVGIQKQEAHNPASLGLLGMRERAQMLGGDCTISGKTGKGTLVTVRIPRPEKKREG
jgi:PAS domain S-box-containing protein